MKLPVRVLMQHHAQGLKQGLFSSTVPTLAVLSPAAPRLLHGPLHLLVLHIWTELRERPPALLLLFLLVCAVALVLRSFGGHDRNIYTRKARGYFQSTTEDK